MATALVAAALAATGLAEAELVVAKTGGGDVGRGCHCGGGDA